MHITSSAFRAYGEIPQRYTCEGANLSPPLSLDARDVDAQSLVLIVNDADSPSGSFAHWVLYNLPPSTTELASAASRATLPRQTKVGTNGFQRVGWAGPCPRAGVAEHRYVFTLYALDVVLPDLGTPTREELIEAMRGRVIMQTELVGTYALRERRADMPPLRRASRHAPKSPPT